MHQEFDSEVPGPPQGIKNLKKVEKPIKIGSGSGSLISPVWELPINCLWGRMELHGSPGSLGDPGGYGEANPTE